MKDSAKQLCEILKDDKVHIVPELYDCAFTKVAQMNDFGIIMVSSGDLACALA